MMKHIYSGVCAALALTVLLLALAPAALADGMDTGTDAIEISPEGAVTLVSGHIGGEGVCSVQFQLRTEGDVSFSFAGDIAGSYLTYCTAGDGTLNIYIAGTAPLMQPGVYSRLLGTVSPADKASPVQSSLQYVYGEHVVMQNAGAEPASSDETDDAVKAQLRSVLDAANALYGAVNDKYTDASWSRLNDAINAIALLLEQQTVTQLEADEAIAAYELAAAELQLAGAEELQAALDAARAEDASAYTPDSFRLLLDAIAAAEAVQAKGADAGSEEIAGAVQALRAAMAALVPMQSADSNGETHMDPRDGGGSDYTPDAPEAPAASEAPAATDMPAAPVETSVPLDAVTAVETASPTATPAPTATAAPTDTPVIGQVPGTGDGTVLLPWAALLGLSAALLALLAVRRGKTRG